MDDIAEAVGFALVCKVRGFVFVHGRFADRYQTDLFNNK